MKKVAGDTELSTSENLANISEIHRDNWQLQPFGGQINTVKVTDIKLKGQKGKHEGMGHWMEKELSYIFLSRGGRVQSWQGQEPGERSGGPQ